MNKDIILKAIERYGIPYEKVEKLGGFENFIYEYEKNGSEYILRFVHSTHREFKHVYAELEFIDYLSKNGANVSTVVPSTDSELVFKVNCNDKDYFSVCVFTKAPGAFVSREDRTSHFSYNLGKAVGKLHKLAKNYKPNYVRYHWHEEDFIDMGRRNIPSEHKEILDLTIRQMDEIKKFERDRDSYGLIHTDLHFGNMFFDGQNLTFFDFDDCAYMHFISDIAIIIFYQFCFEEKYIEQKIIDFIKPFMQGYETENRLDRKWFLKLNSFFKLRELILIIVIFASEDLESDFAKNFLGKYLSRVKAGTPFINLDHVINGIFVSDFQLPTSHKSKSTPR